MDPYIGIRKECVRQATDLHHKFKFVDGSVLDSNETIQGIMGTIKIGGLNANAMSALGGYIRTYLLHQVSQTRAKSTQKLLLEIKGTFGRDNNNDHYTVMSTKLTASTENIIIQKSSNRTGSMGTPYRPRLGKAYSVALMPRHTRTRRHF